MATSSSNLIYSTSDCCRIFRILLTICDFFWSVKLDHVNVERGDNCQTVILRIFRKVTLWTSWKSRRNDGRYKIVLKNEMFFFILFWSSYWPTLVQLGSSCSNCVLFIFWACVYRSFLCRNTCSVSDSCYQCRARCWNHAQYVTQHTYFFITLTSPYKIFSSSFFPPSAVDFPC